MCLNNWVTLKRSALFIFLSDLSSLVHLIDQFVWVEHAQVIMSFCSLFIPFIVYWMIRTLVVHPRDMKPWFFASVMWTLIVFPSNLGVDLIFLSYPLLCLNFLVISLYKCQVIGLVDHVDRSTSFVVDHMIRPLICPMYGPIGLWLKWTCLKNLSIEGMAWKLRLLVAFLILDYYIILCCIMKDVTLYNLMSLTYGFNSSCFYLSISLLLFLHCG